MRRGASPWGSEILDLTAGAIRFRSTSEFPGEVRDCLRYLLDHLRHAELVTEVVDFDGVPSALVRPAAAPRPRVLLCGHLDVVPGENRQFEPVIRGDRLYGRGAWDMKGSLAALCAVVKRTASLAPPWCLLIVTDEETGGKNGAARLAREPWEAELFLAAEPTGLAFSLQSKGVLRLAVETRGRNAHGSQPWEGESAVERMMEVGPKLRTVIPDLREEAWQTTATLSMVKGGTVINQVPDESTVWVDIRHIPDDDPRRLVSRLRKALRGHRVEVLDSYPPMVCREDAPSLSGLREAFRRVTGREPGYHRSHGATDARYFSPRMDALIFGPAGKDLHGPEEWVGIRSLHHFADIMEAWARHLAAAGV
jgi:succinyl-diaminopimelate desuccinylase